MQTAALFGRRDHLAAQMRDQVAGVRVLWSRRRDHLDDRHLRPRQRGEGHDGSHTLLALEVLGQLAQSRGVRRRADLRHEQQGAVEARTKALRQQVVGFAGRRGGGVVAGVREA